METLVFLGVMAVAIFVWGSIVSFLGLPWWFVPLPLVLVCWRLWWVYERVPPKKV